MDDQDIVGWIAGSGSPVCGGYWREDLVSSFLWSAPWWNGVVCWLLRLDVSVGSSPMLWHWLSRKPVSAVRDW